MEEFENLQGFLEHISLVMDADRRRRRGRGLDHDAAFRQGARIRHRVPARLGGRPVPASALARRPGPRRARGGAPPRPCRPHARAPARAHLFRRPTGACTACGRRNLPSRFLDELPEAHVEVTEAKGGFGGYGANYGASRFDDMTHFGSSYSTPGWQRAQARGRGVRARTTARSRRTSQDYAADEPARPSRGSRRRCGRRVPRAHPPLRPAHHRGRAGRQIDRHRLRLRGRRPRVPP